MDELEAPILVLIKEACCHPSGSKERNKKLTEIICLLQQSGKILRGVGVPNAEDALQKTWLYFCRNLCEAVTVEHPFDPERSSIFTWFNAYLQYRFRDNIEDAIKEKNQTAQPSVDDNGNQINPIDLIPIPPDSPPILQEISEWLEQEGSKLRRIHLRDRPDINCKILIERRLPPETSWKKLAAEFGVEISTLSNFYQRECFPRLLNFGKNQGFL